MELSSRISFRGCPHRVCCTATVIRFTSTGPECPVISRQLQPREGPRSFKQRRLLYRPCGYFRPITSEFRWSSVASVTSDIYLAKWLDHAGHRNLVQGPNSPGVPAKMSFVLWRTFILQALPPQTERTNVAISPHAAHVSGWTASQQRTSAIGEFSQTNPTDQQFPEGSGRVRGVRGGMSTWQCGEAEGLEDAGLFGHRPRTLRENPLVVDDRLQVQLSTQRLRIVSHTESCLRHRSIHYRGD